MMATSSRIIAEALSASASATSSIKTALITGSTDGIGLTTAKNLVRKGYNVIIHGRNAKRIEKAVTKVKAFGNEKNSENINNVALPNMNTNTNTNIYSVQADISTLNGCYTLINTVQSILSKNNLSLDLLMNNAGVFEDKYSVTKDGLEMTFAVNVMAPFIITSNLLPQLLMKKHPQKQHQSRVVIASSISQCFSIEPDHWNDLQCQVRQYSTHRAYSESKLLDAMLSAEFATRFQNGGLLSHRITCNSLDPGTVNTKMLLAGWGPCGIDVEDALDQTWLCTSDEVKDTTGAYFNSRSLSKSADAYRQSERQKLWDILSDIDPASAQKWDKLKDYH